MLRKLAEAGALSATWRLALEASGAMTWRDKSMTALMNCWERSKSRPRRDPWDTGLGRDSHFHGVTSQKSSSCPY